MRSWKSRFVEHLEHFLERWMPVFVKKMRQNKELERRSDAVRSNSALSRRALGALALVAALVAARPAMADTLRRVEVRSDLYGVAAISAHIRQAMPLYLKQALAENPVQRFPAGAKLIVRIKEIYLSQDGGAPFPRRGFGGAFAMPDSINSEIIVVDARGKVLLSQPMLANSSPDSGGVGISPYNERRRVDALMSMLAYWVVRRLN